MQQGNETHILQMVDYNAAFQNKLLLWKRITQENHGITDCFPVTEKKICSISGAKVAVDNNSTLVDIKHPFELIFSRDP